MGNAQAHCLQLPNTFAFARGSGRPAARRSGLHRLCRRSDSPGREIHRSILAGLAGSDIAAMWALADTLEAPRNASLIPGRLKGLLFGSPRRFIMDLVMQLARAAFETFRAAAAANGDLREPLRHFVAAAETWQRQHGYENAWWWPGLNEIVAEAEHARGERRSQHAILPRCGPAA